MDFIIAEETLGMVHEVAEYHDLDVLVEEWSGNRSLLRDALRLVGHCRLNQLPKEAKCEIERFITVEFPDTCVNGCAIPLEERVSARDNGGLCGHCSHVASRLDGE